MMNFGLDIPVLEISVLDGEDLKVSKTWSSRPHFALTAESLA